MGLTHNRRARAPNLSLFGPDEPLLVLTPWQILQIDEALASLAASAEVRLVKTRGKLRFIEKLESVDMIGPSS